MQESLEEFENNGATLVALSPQVEEFNKTVVENNALTFDILSDPRNEYSNHLGLRFSLPDNLVTIYDQLGINLPKHNGDDSWTLPMPGRIVASRDGIVRHTDVDPDYTVRPEPYTTIEELKKISQ